MRFAFCFSRSCRPYPTIFALRSLPCWPGAKLRFSIGHLSVKHFEPLRNSFIPSRRQRRHTASLYRAKLRSPYRTEPVCPAIDRFTGAWRPFVPIGNLLLVDIGRWLVNFVATSQSTFNPKSSCQWGNHLDASTHLFDADCRTASQESVPSLRDSSRISDLPSTPPAAPCWAKLFRPFGAGLRRSTRIWPPKYGVRTHARMPSMPRPRKNGTTSSSVRSTTAISIRQRSQLPTES